MDAQLLSKAGRQVPGQEPAVVDRICSQAAYPGHLLQQVGEFRAWRPERYAQVDCRLCHGPSPASVNFRMPSAHLPRLSGAVLLGPEFAKHPETTRLKLDKLVPTMSEALGLSGFSVVTRRGFGCYSCHHGPEGPMFGH